MIRGAAAIVLLGGPALVGLASGGYFAPERLWAALAALVLVVIAAAVAPRPLPRSAAGRVAVAGLAGLLAWTLISRSWAPLNGPAIGDAQRLALYLAVLIASAALLDGRWGRLAEPALAAGAMVLVLYGLSERVLPDAFELTRSRTAFGRLDQPLTYWNAMGALAAMALVLLARLAGDAERRIAVRLGAAACAAPAGAALALTFSRGAIVAAAVGLVALVALAPTRRQLRAALAVAVAAAAAGVLASALPAVRTLEGARASEGAILLAALVVLGAAAALIARGGEDRALRGLRPALALAGVVVAVGLVAASAAFESGTPSDGATAARLGSTDSNRYAYWGVALDAFASAPLRGHGAGSFGVLWLRDRTVPEIVRDAHSIWFETAAELGVVGLALLAMLFGGTAAAALRVPAARVAGPAAALLVWAVHSALDWDWEMPGGPTLTAVVLAGLVLALRDEPHAR
ncbi:MAG TPA: O-antigen ligase family protein [Solirubrobacter sp.]|nr:O-antigen ligase family protein [Solirubrobacter sp.]